MNYLRDSKGRFASAKNVSKTRFTTEKEKSKIFEKSGAFFTIERNGQDKEYHSDEVCVKLTVFIPAANNYIKDKLQFCRRCEVMNDYLDSTWGRTYEKEYRIKETLFYGKRWADVFAEARTYATTELSKLEKMLIDREAALKNAEY